MATQSQNTPLSCFKVMDLKGSDLETFALAKKTSTFAKAGLSIWEADGSSEGTRSYSSRWKGETLTVREIRHTGWLASIGKLSSSNLTPEGTTGSFCSIPQSQPTDYLLVSVQCESTRWNHARFPAVEVDTFYAFSYFFLHHTFERGRRGAGKSG